MNSRVKGLEVLKVLPQGPQEEPELPGLDVVRPVLVVPVALVLGVVEGLVDGRLAVEDLLASQHIPDPFLDLDEYSELTQFFGFICYYLSYLGKGEVAVPVRVEIRKELPPLFLGLFCLLKRKLLIDFVPIDFRHLFEILSYSRQFHGGTKSVPESLL